jgi:hypothetical protein
VLQRVIWAGGGDRCEVVAVGDSPTGVDLQGVNGGRSPTESGTAKTGAWKRQKRLLRGQRVQRRRLHAQGTANSPSGCHSEVSAGCGREEELEAEAEAVGRVSSPKPAISAAAKMRLWRHVIFHCGLPPPGQLYPPPTAGNGAGRPPLVSRYAVDRAFRCHLAIC